MTRPAARSGSSARAADRAAQCLDPARRSGRADRTGHLDPRGCRERRRAVKGTGAGCASTVVYDPADWPRRGDPHSPSSSEILLMMRQQANLKRPRQQQSIGARLGNLTWCFAVIPAVVKRRAGIHNRLIGLHSAFAAMTVKSTIHNPYNSLAACQTRFHVINKPAASEGTVGDIRYRHVIGQSPPCRWNGRCN